MPCGVTAAREPLELVGLGSNPGKVATTPCSSEAEQTTFNRWAEISKFSGGTWLVV